MKLRYGIAIATLSAALSCGSALAAGGTTTGQVQDTGSFSGWMTDYSAAHGGRISRQAYLDEAARRWDINDRNKQGLTVEEINRMNGVGEGQAPVSSQAPGAKPAQK